MKIESTSFSPADLAVFMDELVDRDRRQLVERLERVTARLGELGPRVPDGPAEDARPADGGWTAREVLAHIAVLSKFYGVLAYRVGTGVLTSLDLLGQVSLRDEAGSQMARLPPAAIAESALSDQRRTLAWLRSANPTDLRRRCEIGADSWLTADEFVRLPLVSHLEQHLDQLEAAL